MPGALSLLERLGVHPSGRPLRGVSYRNGRRHADHPFASGAGLGVRRTTLHAALAERAAALGVERVVGKVEQVEQDRNGVTAGGVRARWMFGCDGLHSTVRRVVGLQSEVSRSGRRFGLRQHYFVEPWTDLIEVHWSGRVEAYVTPVSDDLVGVCILGPQHTDFQAALAGVVGLPERLAGAAPAGSLRGAGPLLQRATSPAAGRVLLVGDSSGYVDAITGEGLRLGFDQARAAVKCVLADNAQDYPAEWNRITRDFRRITSALVAAANGPFRPAIVPAASALPRLYGSIVERLAR